MLKLDNKILVDTNGVPLGRYEIPPVEVTFNSNIFPPYKNPTATFSTHGINFYGSGANAITFDWGDGSALQTIEFNNNFISNGSTITSQPRILKTYSTTAVRTVKMYIRYPNKISKIIMDQVNFTNEFPKSIGLFRLNNLEVNRTLFNNFPTTFNGGIFNNLFFNQSFNGRIVSVLPNGISNSKVSYLKLEYSFNFNNQATNKLEDLINIEGLNSLSLYSCNLGNNSLPNNLKDISTLRKISIANNPINTFPQQISDCQQITYLELGRTANTIGRTGECLSLTSWGSGIGGMNITELWVEGREYVSSNFVSTGITGLENCSTLKNIQMRSVFPNQPNMDDFINNLYTQVTAIPPLNSTSGAMRGITLNLSDCVQGGYIAVPRPSGVYQAPTGFNLYTNNGTPANPMEKIYVLVKNYKWKITIVGTSGRSSTEVFNP